MHVVTQSGSAAINPDGIVGRGLQTSRFNTSWNYEVVTARVFFFQAFALQQIN
jgi:hypothetical protein